MTVQEQIEALWKDMMEVQSDLLTAMLTENLPAIESNCAEILRLTKAIQVLSSQTSRELQA